MTYKRISTSYSEGTGSSVGSLRSFISKSLNASSRCWPELHRKVPFRTIFSINSELFLTFSISANCGRSVIKNYHWGVNTFQETMSTNTGSAAAEMPAWAKEKSAEAGLLSDTMFNRTKRNRTHVRLNRITWLYALTWTWGDFELEAGNLGSDVLAGTFGV